MTTPKAQAQVLATALDIGLISHDEVVAWADAVLAQQATPHWSLCDLATSRGQPTRDVIDMLRAVPGEVDAGAIQDLLVGFLSDALEREPAHDRRIVKILYDIAPDLRDLELQRFAMWADDAWDLAEAGISGTWEGVVAELHTHLADAAERAALRGRAWKAPP